LSSNLSEIPAAALPADLRRALDAVAGRLGAFAGRATWFPVLPSTNDLASRLADGGAPEGTVVVADRQTAGRGRQGRAWCSPPGAGLYVSVLLRPPARATGLLTLAAGVALADGIQAATGFPPVLKWPNDILAHGRKVGGILAEAGTAVRAVQHVVLGFGINISVAALPPEVARIATALETELGRPVDGAAVLAECLAALWREYEQLVAGAERATLDRWRERARPMLGRAVEWDRDGRVLCGVAEDVDASGALVIRSGGGTERLIAGEVRWVR
jgi:BirA family transcriptional regulator, biotin operon repressor / biotin---[acetyl-CoA-carboxylase] ligase